MSIIFKKLNTLLLALFLSGLFAGSWLLIQNLTDKQRIQRPHKTHVPDALITQMRYQSTDEQGEVKSALQAKKTIHYPDDVFKLDKPIFKAFKENDAIWTVISDRGEVTGEDHVIKLFGHVNIDKKSTMKKEALHFESSQVTIYPKSNQMETDQPFILIKPGMVIHATGLKADMKSEKVQFLSRTKITYQPTEKRFNLNG